MIIHGVENLKHILGFDEARLLSSKKSKLIRCYLENIDNQSAMTLRSTSKI